MYFNTMHCTALHSITIHCTALPYNPFSYRSPPAPNTINGEFLGYLLTYRCRQGERANKRRCINFHTNLWDKNLSHQIYLVSAFYWCFSLRIFCQYVTVLFFNCSVLALRQHTVLYFENYFEICSEKIIFLKTNDNIIMQAI